MPDSPAFHNRILAVMAHTTRYAFQGQARLAKDCDVSRSAISRILSGQSRPTFALALAITEALEKELGQPLDPRELLSFNGTYPTPSACMLCGCRGCLPQEAYQADDTLKPEYRGIKPNHWPLAPPE